LVAGVVLTGSTGHATQLPLTAQSGATLDDAAAANVVAEIADQTQLVIAPQIQSNAQSLSSQVNVPTSASGTLASPDVVNTAGATGPGITTYTTQPGDTVQSIATEFNVSTDTILWANNLSSGAALTPGQQLTILPVSGVQYTVQPGDTAQSVASHFQADPNQILAFNSDQGSGLQAGQTIVVPNGVIPQAAPVATTTSNSNASVVSSPAPIINTVGGANGYAFGYCTWYVATRRAIPSDWGNANQWYYNAIADGYSVGSVPRPGAIAWTGAGYYGHVAYVESVSGDNVTVSEMNWNGGWDRVDYRTVSASSFRYIY
jgi:surface antigen